MSISRVNGGHGRQRTFNNPARPCTGAWQFPRRSLTLQVVLAPVHTTPTPTSGGCWMSPTDGSVATAGCQAGHDERTPRSPGPRGARGRPASARLLARVPAPRAHRAVAVGCGPDLTRADNGCTV